MVLGHVYWLRCHFSPRQFNSVCPSPLDSSAGWTNAFFVGLAHSILDRGRDICTLHQRVMKRNCSRILCGGLFLAGVARGSRCTLSPVALFLVAKLLLFLLLLCLCDLLYFLFSARELYIPTFPMVGNGECLIPASACSPLA